MPPRVVLIPDSFKGTLSALCAAETMAEAVRKVFPKALITALPIADGGEGTVDAFLSALGGKKIAARVQGPLGVETDTFYGFLENQKQLVESRAKKSAVVEMAAAAGLPLAAELGPLQPELTTTYGAGQLIEAALAAGAEKVIVGLGGSSTNDGGAGMAAALGVRFFDEDGVSFVPTGGTLKKIHGIDLSGLNPALQKTEITAICDIRNPLYGKQGAAYVFSPQKGAAPEMVRLLDEGLRHLAFVVKRSIGLDAARFPGAGAAGGMGYGMKVFLGAVLKSGIETVLDAVNFDALLKEAAIVFTGEGKFDQQSLMGKALGGIAARCKKAGIPLAVIAGCVNEKSCECQNCAFAKTQGFVPVKHRLFRAAFKQGIHVLRCTNRARLPFGTELKSRAKEDLSFTVEETLKSFVF